MLPDEVKHKAKEIKHTAMGRVLFEYMKIRKADIATQMVAAREPVDIFRLQGRAQETDDLLKLLDSEK